MHTVVHAKLHGRLWPLALSDEAKFTFLKPDALAHECIEAIEALVQRILERADVTGRVQNRPWRHARRALARLGDHEQGIKTGNQAIQADQGGKAVGNLGVVDSGGAGGLGIEVVHLGGIRLWFVSWAFGKHDRLAVLRGEWIFAHIQIIQFVLVRTVYRIVQIVVFADQA